MSEVPLYHSVDYGSLKVPEIRGHALNFIEPVHGIRFVKWLVLEQIVKQRVFYKEIGILKSPSFIVCTRTSCFTNQHSGTDTIKFCTRNGPSVNFIWAC